MKIFTLRSMLLCVLCSLSMIAVAQNVKTVQQKFANYTFASPAYNHQNYFKAMAPEMQLSAQTGMQLIKETPGRNGMRHYRYQQSYQGLPVVANIYILHEKNGKVVSANGLFTPQLNINTTAGITATDAENTARIHMLAKISKAAPKGAAFDLLELVKKPVLCIIDAAYPHSSGTMRLAYQLQLYAAKPIRKMLYYIDAHTGNYIASTSLIHEHGVTGTLITRYYGAQTATVDSIAPTQFTLRDITRGNGIEVSSSKGATYSSLTKVFDLKNDNRDEAALDAFFVAQRYFDFLKDTYGRNGLDDGGLAPKIRIHENSSGRVNAFWDGEYGNFGDGDCSYGPLTSAEVVAHEFTHGLTQFTSGLIYESESGAINESISDMFGKAFEFMLDRDHFSWTLGTTLFLTPQSSPIRVMDDPHALKQPAMYKGQYWEDNADVHYNSSIGNLWFVMLVDGKTGTNEAGTDYSVQGIGMLDALKIAYAANTHYNTPSTNYAAFAQNTLAAATELYGVNSAEAKAVTEAWKAVGVSGSVDPGLKYDLAIRLENSSNPLCSSSGQVAAYYIVTNYGSETYNGTSGATVTVKRDEQTEAIIPLTVNLGPGESTQVLFNLNVDEEVPFMYYTLDLDYSIDEAPENNIASTFFEVQPYGVNDLSVEMYIPGGASCRNTKFEFLTVVENKGCDTIPAGTQLELKLNDANQNNLETLPFTLEKPLLPGQILIKNFSVPNGISETQLIVMELHYDKETEPSDNIANEFFTVNRTIVQQHKEDFESWPVNSIVGNFNNVFLRPEAIAYHNSKMLAFSAFNQDTSERQHCESPGLYFDNENYLSTNGFNICVDYSTDPAPVKLSFDLALIRNIYNDNNPFAYSSMLKVEWEGTQSGMKIIYDQPEGAVVNNTITLPGGFSGTIKFTTYTELDNGVPLVTQEDLDIGDVVLIDNLVIGSTSKVHKTVSGDMMLYPNPAAEQLHVHLRNNATLSTVRINDISGRTVFSNNYSGVLDIHSLQPGIYFLTATDDKHVQHVARFVVSR